MTDISKALAIPGWMAETELCWLAEKAAVASQSRLLSGFRPGGLDDHPIAAKSAAQGDPGGRRQNGSRCTVSRRSIGRKSY
jgi:hypothetical protein